ncbi:MAG TPA: YegP family protein [Frankiaceae bacterium]|nr:YegP family protein [Frankiaceae bacterium]
MRFVINSSGTQVYFEIQSDGNYETLATSERYKDKDDALAAIDIIKAEAATAQTKDNT